MSSMMTALANRHPSCTAPARQHRRLSWRDGERIMNWCPSENSMNEALDRLRGRLRAPIPEPPKNRMLPKDWITIGVSVAALVVSLTTAYFNVFYFSDEIAVAVERAHHTAINP